MRTSLIACFLIAACITPVDGLWHVGDRWDYGDAEIGVWTNITVVGRERIGDRHTYVVDVERVQPAGTSQERVWFDQSSLGFVAGSQSERPEVVFSCPLARIFPLEDQDYACQAAGHGFHVHVVSRIGATAQVETPAGTFEAIGVSFPTFRYSNDPHAHEWFDNQYAPAVRNWLWAQGTYCADSPDWADCGPNPVPLVAHN